MLSDEEKQAVCVASNALCFTARDRFISDVVRSAQYEKYGNELYAVVDQIAESRARGARDLLRKASAFLPLLSSIERQETVEYIVWLQRAIAAELARLEEKP